MVINHLVDNCENHLQSLGIITYIDFVAAFDSILHSYILSALKEYGVPNKYCRIIQQIYQTAAVRVRIQEPSGTKCYSRNIPIRRGVIQGDIPSPVFFVVSLDKLLKDYGGTNIGIKVTNDLILTDLEFADDAALPDENTAVASERITEFNRNANEQAGMTISIPKTKVQHIMRRPKVSGTTEEDVNNLPDNLKFKFQCDKCDMSYPTKHGLAVHKGRWCRGKRNQRKPSRKGTVADRVVQRYKVEEFQKTMEKVTLGEEELENVYSFCYLGAEIPGDGDSSVTVKHRCDIARGRFGEYRTSLTSTKLPQNLETLCFACRFHHGIWVKCVTVNEEVTTSCKWSKFENASSNHMKKLNTRHLTQSNIFYEDAGTTWDIYFD